MIALESLHFGNWDLEGAESYCRQLSNDDLAAVLRHEWTSNNNMSRAARLEAARRLGLLAQVGPLS